MILDLNTYKKIDKDLSELEEKHNELEKSLNAKLDDITHQRDDLQNTCAELKAKVQEYEQLKTNYDGSSNLEQLQQELNEVKAKNDLLRQRNWKIIEQLNKLSQEQKPNPSS